MMHTIFERLISMEGILILLGILFSVIVLYNLKKLSTGNSKEDER